MAVLLLAEMSGTELALDATAKAVTAAKSLGDVTVLCASSGCDGAAALASQLDGVSKVLCADDDALHAVPTFREEVWYGPRRSGYGSESCAGQCGLHKSGE